MKKQKNLPVFSTEKNNLAGFNSFKYSSIAKTNNAGLKFEKNGKKKRGKCLEKKIRRTRKMWL
jgi:hypothetical protein